MNTKAKYPISRNPLFFDSKMDELYQRIGSDFCSSWMNMKVILYQVDRIKTNVDDLYGETHEDNIKYSTPIELPCIYEISKSENAAYIKNINTARYKQAGNITIWIYDKILSEYDCDIKYGDLFGVVIDEHTIFYYECTDDGKRNFANTETMYGFKRFWREIKAVEIDENVFSG
jgi:hypothetical protein